MRSAAEAARLEAERWRRKGGRQKRAGTAERRAVREKAAAQRLLVEREEARRLLRRKLQWAKHTDGLRHDPEALLALVAELYAELTTLRSEVSMLRRKVAHPDAWPF